MYSTVVLFACVLAFVAVASAVQCEEITNPSTCRETIDDNRNQCVWCGTFNGICECIAPPRNCAANVECSDGDSNGLSGGETAGIVVGVLLACCCCVVLCVGLVTLAAGVAVLLGFKLRSSASSNA